MEKECRNIIEIAEGPTVCGDEFESDGKISTECKACSAKTWVRLPFEEALSDTRGALLDQGFGIICELDMQRMFKEKLGADSSPYTVLGVCMPDQFHQALEQEKDFGLLIPCNVVVYEQGDGSIIETVDPVSLLSVMDGHKLESIAQEIKQRLKSVVARVAGKAA